MRPAITRAVFHPSHHARTHPDKPAYLMAHSGEVVTYGQLEARSNKGAQLFRSLGLERGDAVALLLDNNARYFEILWAAQRAGLFFTAMSTRLAAQEAEYIIGDCGAKLLLVSASLAPQAAALRARNPGVAHRYAVGGHLPGHASWEDACAAQPAARIADESAGRDMLYSSGTTGRPKGIKTELLDEAIDAPTPLLNVAAKLYGLGPEAVYLSPAPLYHAAPLRFNMTVMRFGGTAVIMEHFDAETALALIERHGVTHSQWVPTMFVRMLKLAPEVRLRYRHDTLRCAIHAAAPCPVEVKQQMIDWWGPVLYEYYAGTEGNGFVACDSEEWLAHRGTVGRALVGELRILDDEGRVLPPGETGTIYFANGPAFEYHNDPQKTADSRSKEGWSTLGDVGTVDAEGYLYLTDRRHFMIISGGVNIYPQEVENLLVTHPKVADVAVIGVPNAEFGEEVKAVVQPIDMREASLALAEELIAFCRANLSHVKCPKSVDFEAELPRHPTGKLYKRLLRDRYWEKKVSGTFSALGKGS
ncbi:MAG: AMP-binding protein [Burkholderiales bacterium]|nr:AMP-binding protein [Burkholderiales bacterium]